MARLCAEGRSGSGSAEGGALRIMEEISEERDLVQLKSDVFMNTVGMFRVVLLG